MAVFNGTNRSEIIRGSNFRDIIFGNGGNDDIYGRDGNDDLFGNAGNDFIFGGSGQDFIYGGPGVNNLWGDSGADRFIEQANQNSFSDNWIGDFQFGVDRIDVSAWGVSDFSQLKALFQTDGRGDAYLNAYYNGYDHFLTIADVRASQLISADFIYDNSAAKTENGTRFGDVMFGSDFNDNLSGDTGDDTLLGGDGDDRLRGNGGDDDLIGNAGSDTLAGGRGRDILTGDSGADIFDFNNLRDSRDGSTRDVITDFNQNNDLIDLRGVDADGTQAGNQQFDWIGNANFSAPGQLNFFYSSGNTIIAGNVDGDSNAEFEIVLVGRYTPTQADFFL
jgi:Ca2+-binding RTX toxin-like protein